MRKPKKIPERMCTACRTKKPKQELVRIVCAEGSKAPIIDWTGKKNGRGAYICNSIECLRRAQKTKALQRALEVTISPEWYAQQEACLQNKEQE